MKHCEEEKGTGAKGLVALLTSLFGIGCIGFGGGSALIPVFQERLAGKAVSRSEFDDCVAIACVTPGALPIELAAGIGYRTRGLMGMLLSAAAVALPGALLLLVFLALLYSAQDTVVEQVGFLALGVSGYIISVVYRYIKGVVTKGTSAKAKALSVLIVVLVFAVTCEKSLYRLFGMSDHFVVFAIGTVDVMIIAFFLAVWIRDKRTVSRVVPGLLVALLYCLSVGGFGTEYDEFSSNAIAAAMLIMAVVSLRGDSRENHKHLRLESPVHMLKGVLVSFAVLAALSLPALLLCPGTLEFLAGASVSSLLSFGGGDAYIAMADGFFVEGGLLDEETFYSLIVPIVNALPGSILCKVVTATGYCVAVETSSSLVASFAMAVAGFACAVSMSCITYVVAHYFYETLEGLKSFATLRRIIGCVVSGLLMTVALGLLNTCAKSAAVAGVGAPFAVGLCLLLAVANVVSAHRFGMHPLLAVILSAGFACAVCNFL